ncbi:MAG: RloB domain-containing protein [Mycoplasmataceae bacterium]|nr:RloB domain-containing protein [Mycoplasmataceae bacterium]
MNSNKFKYSLITEGKMEEVFFTWLKDSSIYKNKIYSKCKSHSVSGKGTLHEKLIINSDKNCCNKYFIFDVDNITKEVPEKCKKSAKDKNITLIINNPCLEIILLSFFKYCDQTNLTKAWIEEKLNIELKKLSWELYNHDLKSLGKLLNNLAKSEEHQKNFKTNLIKYKQQTNNPNSNFIDLIIMLERDNNG